MENIENEYFHIELEMLGESQLFPFNVFIYNPSNETYTPYLYGNSPLTEEKKNFLDYILEKGAELAISMKQKKTFLRDRELKEEDIPDLAPTELHELIVKREKLLEEKMASKEKKGKFHFNDELKKAYENDDFTAIIEEAHSDLICLGITISPTVSLATFFAENLLIGDTYVNRVVALSHLLAKNSGMIDDLALGELACASFMAHLGQTQMEKSLSDKAYLEMTDSQRKKYKKHAGLTQHMTRKAGIELSERCMRIILQHHERYDGSGYPDQTKGQYIEPLALVLGCAAHILEYTTGKITGTKTPLQTVLSNMKNKTLSPGLEIEFGDSLYNSLTNIFGDKINIDSKEAA
ncbi:MAG: hypothetical protein GY909_08080 [Oligoflexia bacterium]|nr:hypothetical protein [Oligoflexia bacterium]